MSALANDAIEAPIIDRETMRSLVVVRPVVRGRPRYAWTMDSYSLPVPSTVAHLVRDGRQWRMVVQAAIERFAGFDTPYSIQDLQDPQGPYQTFLKTLMFLGPGSDELGRLVVLMYPPLPCQNKRCDRHFIPYSRRVRQCSEQCRRAVEDAKESRRGR